MVSVALIVYIAATAVGMVVGSFGVPLWFLVWPLVLAAALAAGTFVHVSGRLIAFRHAFAGDIWGALAGSFAASTCGPTHGHLWSGSHVAALVTGLVALALAVIADLLPRAVASRPHALCGVLFLSTVGIALALGAEVPRWP